MKILEALNHETFSPQLLINSLKEIPELKREYRKRVRHYILERHTILVLSEFEKYFGSKDFPQSMDKSLFRLMLALHDIGKAKAAEEGNINQQHEITKQIILNIKDQLPINNKDLILLLSIINDDPIGLYMQNKISLHTAKSIIVRNAKNCGLSINVFFRILVIYYQSDVASYTKDAGGLRFLEWLFEYNGNTKVFDKKTNRLKFSDRIETKFKNLKLAVLT